MTRTQSKMAVFLIIALAVLLVASVGTYIAIDYWWPTNQSWIESNLDSSRVTLRFDAQAAKDGGFSNSDIATVIAETNLEQRALYTRLLLLIAPVAAVVLCLVSLAMFIRERPLEQPSVQEVTPSPLFLSHIGDYQAELKLKCFEYCYWFARFEFALKENGFVKNGPYDAALADWDKFRNRFASVFTPSSNEVALLSSPPQRQVLADGRAEWQTTSLDRESSELGKVILVLKTIRNNLFHGGKSSQADWDNPERNLFYLTHAKRALDLLATIGSLEADYERYY